MHTVGRHTTARQESEAPPFSHAHLAPALDPPTRTMPRCLKTTWAKLNPSSSRRPPMPPPTSSSESDLKVNLEDDPDRETASEEEPEPLPVEEVIFNSLEMAQKEEEDQHLRAITQMETNDCILKRIIEISKEEERHREEEEKRRREEEEHRREEEEERLRQEETERRLVMDAERHRPRDDKEQLKDIGLEIASKCGGVPLAAQSLGYTLRFKDLNDWVKVNESDVWNEPNSKDGSLQNQGQEGIRPRMFKSVIAVNHPEFSSMRQQDALDFFLHLIDRVEKANPGNHEQNPCSGFKFVVEERVQCPSGKVSYNKRSDYILSLSIPLLEATNKEQLEAFNEKKAAMDLDGKEVSNEDIVRPRVPLEACLASFSGPEEIPDFYSTALNSKTTATKTAGFNTFPDYLVLHMRKFVMKAGWVPKKLDVYIDVPDTIDITHMRSKGVQPGEELLPEGGSGDYSAEPAHPVASEDIVSQLASMGFNYLHCQKAAINTSNTGVEEAMNWLLSHMDDPDINDPISKDSRASEPSVDEASVQTLVSFGFQEDVAITDLKASGGNIEKATDWIFSHPEASS
ncbi:ubiquitin carboxyl-terminal hydrolase 14-like [Miscanthus floridulus]|uniref:ubiquitin carboxyl-terminal hydrolase 14-like n=1 Tax=Miscanthus floridulus TaxID=154761 RepID=UPI00345A7B21